MYQNVSEGIVGIVERIFSKNTIVFHLFNLYNNGRTYSKEVKSYLIGLSKKHG